MSEPIDEKAIVLDHFPDAVAIEHPSFQASHRWIIHLEATGLFAVGSGPTEPDAWHDAWVHIDTVDQGKARLEREGGR